MFQRVLDWEQRGIRMLESCHRRLTATYTEHYLSTCTTDLRALHFYNRTGGTCYGPVPVTFMELITPSTSYLFDRL